MRAEEVPAEIVRAHTLAWYRDGGWNVDDPEEAPTEEDYAGCDESSRALIAAVWPLIARRVLIEAAREIQTEADKADLVEDEWKRAWDIATSHAKAVLRGMSASLTETPEGQEDGEGA